MASVEAYRTIAERAQAEIVEKKSRFIAHLVPVQTEDEALAFLQEIRQKHAQARHNVYAYILRNGRVRYSDDGEPAQTAGIPTYEALKHADLTDIACVTTRYFGGTLLGTGGLVRAYTDSVNAAIQAAKVVVITRCVDVTVAVPYNLYEPLTKLADGETVKLHATDFAEAVTMTFRTPEANVYALCAQLTETTRGQCEPESTAPFDAAF